MLHPDALKRLKMKKSLIGTNKCPRIDFGDLKEVCQRPIDSFHVFKGVGNFVKVQTPHGPYFYKDNGAKVLVVAHLDTVQEFHWAGVLSFKDETKIYCTTLDDRLGVYVTLDLLKKAGLEYDILLTTNEEAGDSSAQWFEPPQGKKYNWIAEFDRKGTDVVTYQYHQTDWRLALKQSGFPIGFGHYSDISDMDHLGVCAVNIGIGYYEYHTSGAYAKLSEIKSQVSRFIQFYKANAEIEFQYTPRYNVLSDKGLSYSPYIIGKFSREEYDYALDLYEQIKAGQSLESLGYPDSYRLIPGELIQKEAKIYHLPKKKDKGSEDEVVASRLSSVERLSVVYPQPLNTTAKEVAEDIARTGLKTIIAEKCIECGNYFSPAEPNTEPFCPTCKVVIENRHAKDDEPKQIASHFSWKSYKEKKREAKAKKIYIPEDKESLDKIANAQIAGALALMKDGKSNPIDLGTILRMIREGIPEELAKPIFDDLIKAKIIRQFKYGRLGKSNYPQNAGTKVQITHGAIAALMTKDGYEEELKISSATSYQKWVSKAETGHKLVWSNFKDSDMLYAYLIVLGELVEDKWLPVINRLSGLGIESIMKEYAKLPGTISAKPENKSKKDSEPKAIVLGIKFKLDTTNRDYEFGTERIDGKIVTKWERVKHKATA